jgi:hypothetical protein
MDFALATVLIAIAGVHILWGVGYWFPIRDEAALARAVVGTHGITRMPGAVPCALVAVALLFLASVLFWPTGGLRQGMLWAAAAVFGLRGAVAYAPFWRRIVPEQPFARLDRQFYAPLCLLIGIGLLAV